MAKITVKNLHLGINGKKHGGPTPGGTIEMEFDDGQNTNETPQPPPL